jgi:glycyl-radical enzyme activating protein
MTPMPLHDAPSDQADLAATGTVFDVQRASLHDGPGIRTTVFLKGCPLRCAWCHNPESQAASPQLSFDPERCLGCRLCAAACASGVHRFDGAGRHMVEFDRCDARGNCVSACTAGALRIYGKTLSVGAVLGEAERDMAYYQASGGGLTLSGGEPTMQEEFCISLLRAARGRGIHTCIETCGVSSRETYERLLPFTDLFLFDYKATGERRHLDLTGGSARSILRNLHWLHDQGARIVLRCPMIPRVNDDMDHIRTIAGLKRELPRLLGVELLPYHDAGVSKYGRIGRARPALRTELPAKHMEARWRARLEEAERER